MKKNNPKATISEESKAMYRQLMKDMEWIEVVFRKQNKVIKCTPKVRATLFNQFVN